MSFSSTVGVRGSLPGRGAAVYREDCRLINPVNNVSVPVALPTSGPGKVDAAAGAASFQDLLLDAIREAGSTQKTGPAETLAAARKADDALRMMIEIQNRMVQAFQEVQNIRV